MFGFTSAGQDAGLSVVVLVSWQLGLGKLEWGVRVARETRRRKCVWPTWGIETKADREGEGVPGGEAKREAEVGHVNEDEAETAGGENVGEHRDAVEEGKRNKGRTRRDEYDRRWSQDEARAKLLSLKFQYIPAAATKMRA
ncbi:hypothetical protein K438DRAFT_1783906 [Mycena galopus ATCC 62051]|nr:hypothetical protein K438DRAFT_1783906 [Mycena galopus ATCC 62051]